jgi:predicted ATP-dependent protease
MVYTTGASHNQTAQPKSGSFLRAHGGYLIFSLEDAITEPALWKVLKRTLRSKRIEMETYEPFAMFSSFRLKARAG